MSLAGSKTSRHQRGRDTRRIPSLVTPPRLVGSNTNPNPRAPRELSRLEAPVLDPKRRIRHVEAVLPQRDAERLREVARTSAQSLDGNQRGAAGSAGAAPLHQVDPLARLERAQQHGRGKPVGLGDDVRQEVDAVVQVDVRDAGWAVQRLVAPRGTRRGVAGRIVFADVGLDLDDAPGARCRRASRGPAPCRSDRARRRASAARRTPAAAGAASVTGARRAA